MENINLKPEVRFSEFTKDWKESKFENHFEFKNTNSLSRDKLNYENGEVMNIHYGDIHTKFNTHFDIENEDLPFINQDIDISRIAEENYVQNGDLVMADASEDYADIGKTIEITNIKNKKILAGLHTFLARKTDNTLANGFFGHLLTNYNLRLELMRIAQGTKVLGLSKGRVEKIPLLIPEQEEQQKIADFLTAIDKRINLLKEKETNLIEYKKGVMQKIFNQEIRFKDDNGDDFPDWNDTVLDDIVEYYDGTHQTPKYVKEGIPFYSVEHVTANQFSQTRYISKEVYEKENIRVKLEKGDILMTRIGSVGKVKYIDWDVNASFYVSLALIKGNPNINGRFLANYIQFDDFQREIWKRTIHVAFPQKINLNEIGKCKVSIPHTKEQVKIANYMTSLDSKIDALHNKISATVNLKRGLLQKMFV